MRAKCARHALQTDAVENLIAVEKEFILNVVAHAIAKLALREDFLALKKEVAELRSQVEAAKGGQSST